MVLLWVYRAAEIQKNLLAKITADTLPHQVRACVCVFSPISHPRFTCLTRHHDAGRLFTQPSVQLAAHVICPARHADSVCRGSALLVRFLFLFAFFPRFFVSKSIVRPGTSVASCLAAPISALACRHTLVLQPSYQQQPRQVPVSTKSHVTT